MMLIIALILVAVGCLLVSELLYAYCTGFFDKKPKTWRDRLAEEGDPYHCRQLHNSWSHGDGAGFDDFDLHEMINN